MTKIRIPTTRKTVTLTDAVWTAIEDYRQDHQIPTITDTIDRLVKAGLTVKVAVVGKNAKRRSL
jgi:hypothetical protein